MSAWGCTFRSGVALFKQSRIALFKHVRGGVGFLQQNTLIKYHGFRKTIGNDTFSDRKLMKIKQFRARVWIGVKWSWSYYVMWPRSDATAGGERKRETHTLSIKWKVWIGSSCHNLLWEREKLGPRTSRLEVWGGRRGTIVWFIYNFATIIDQRCEDIINPPRIGFEQGKRDCYQWQELRAGHLINLLVVLVLANSQAE